MTPDEFRILEIVFLTIIGSFLALALPGYAWLRKAAPKLELDPGKDISGSVIKPFDLIVVGFYLLIFAWFVKAADPEIESKNAVDYSVGLVVAGGIAWLMLAALIPAVISRRSKMSEFFGLRWRDWPHVFWIIPAFIFTIFLLAFGLSALDWQNWVKDQFGSESQKSVKLLLETSDTGLLVAIAVSAVVVAPLAEEMIFRGYLYPVVKHFTNRWYATIFTGILFGVVHSNLMSLPVLCLIGIILAILYEKTGSLWAVIGCHAAFNGFQVGAMLLMRFNLLPTQP